MNYIKDKSGEILTQSSTIHLTKDLDLLRRNRQSRKILKDWCTIYDSKYSPKSNYGDVKLKPVGELVITWKKILGLVTLPNCIILFSLYASTSKNILVGFTKKQAKLFEPL